MKSIMQEKPKKHIKEPFDHHILEQSKEQKLTHARKLKSQQLYIKAIQIYHKVLFLEENPQYLMELGEIYEKQLLDLSSAILFYRRAQQLLKIKPKGKKNKNSHTLQQQIKEKLSKLIKIKGLQLLQLGSCKNILQGLVDETVLTESLETVPVQYMEDYVLYEFKKIYPSFQKRLIDTYILKNHPEMIPSSLQKELETISSILLTALGYLEMNYRDAAYQQIQRIQLLQLKNVDFLVLGAFTEWSVLETAKGFRTMWEAFRITRQLEYQQLEQLQQAKKMRKKKPGQVATFLNLINPMVAKLYKEAKYDLIENHFDKCQLKVEKGLSLHPYHTQLLILRAFLHRRRQEFKKALQRLQEANKQLYLANYELSLQAHKQKSKQLNGQISLTYNEMAIYLYKQQKYNEAIDLFNEAINFNSDDFGLYTNRGDCYRALNNYVKALESYLLAYEYVKTNKELNFRISSIYSIRAVTLFNSKNYELALKEFDASLKYSPGVESFVTGKVRCLVQMDRKNEAVILLEQLLRADNEGNGQEARKILETLKDTSEKRGPNNRKIIQLSKDKY